MISISELSYIAGLSKRNKRITYYLILVLIHVYIEYWSRSIFSHVSFFKHLCYLTNISFFLNLFYYFYVLIMHVPYGNKIKHLPFLQAYFRICYSISFLVFVLYWGFILINPQMLIRDRSNFPLALDFFLHGMNFILNFIEHVYVFPKSDSESVGVFSYLLITSGYAIFIKSIYHFLGTEVYPLVSKTTIIEFSIIVVIATLILFIGDFFYKSLLKKDIKEKKH
jgi:hypothetical protein